MNAAKPLDIFLGRGVSCSLPGEKGELKWVQWKSVQRSADTPTYIVRATAMGTMRACSTHHRTREAMGHHPQR